MAVPEKLRVAKKQFVLPDGTFSNDVKPESTGLTFAFSNGERLTLNFADVPSTVRHCAMARGFAEDIGNTYAGAKGDADAAYDDAKARIEILMGGEWYTHATGGAGPAPSLILSAIEAMVVANGEAVDEARRAKWREMVGSKEGREKALANPKVKSHFERMKAERAIERADKAAKAAETASPSDTAF